MSTVNETKLAWLAGIVDGEGCISFYTSRSRHVRKDGARCSSLRINVHVANTDECLINEVAAIAKEHSLKYGIKFVARQNANHKTRIDIVFAGSKRSEAILKLILPYLVAKKGRAELALSVIAHRRNTRGLQQVHIKDDVWLNTQLAEWKSLNHRGA